MKNILIISSKKYTKLKNYTDFVSLIKSRKLEFHISFVEDVEQYDNYLNKDTLVVSFGGDGTALKAMKISWTYNLLFMPLGTCLLYTSPSPRDGLLSRMPSSA